MKFTFDVNVRIHMEHTPGDKTSRLRRADVKLDFPGDESDNEDKDGYPTAKGIKTCTTGLIAALSTNIHYAHENGLWDSAKQLRFIIKELESHFVQLGDAQKGIWGEEQ